MATQAPETRARGSRPAGVETRPAPQQLSTPTDLNLEQVAAVTKVVNGLIADAFALNVKTKNYHWHLAGPHFRDYHLMFDEQAGLSLRKAELALAQRTL